MLNLLSHFKLFLHSIAEKIKKSRKKVGNLIDLNVIYHFSSLVETSILFYLVISFYPEWRSPLK